MKFVLPPDELYKQQHWQQNKVHVLIYLQNNNWFTKSLNQINIWCVNYNQHI